MRPPGEQNDGSMLLLEKGELGWPQVRDYLVARGFQLVPTGWSDAGVFRKGDADVLLPFDTTFGDYHEALIRAVVQIARFEGREPFEVVADLKRLRSEEPALARAKEGTADGDR